MPSDPSCWPTSWCPDLQGRSPQHLLALPLPLLSSPPATSPCLCYPAFSSSLLPASLSPPRTPTPHADTALHPPPHPFLPLPCPPSSKPRCPPNTSRAAASPTRPRRPHWDPLGAARIQGLPLDLQNTSAGSTGPAGSRAGRCSCMWRRQGVCDFIPFGVEPGVKLNTPSC